MDALADILADALLADLEAEMEAEQIITVATADSTRGTGSRTDDLVAVSSLASDAAHRGNDLIVARA
jgi:hypothetical protein